MTIKTPADAASRDIHPWAADLGQLYAQIWARLARGVHDRHAPARHVTLATLGENGFAQLRTVVLRGCDAGARSLDIYTDAASAKVGQLRANPRAGLHVWDASAHLQTRIEAEVEIIQGPEVAGIWAMLPDDVRLNFGCTPPTGQPIDGSLDYEKRPDPATFTVLRAHVCAIDAVHLGPVHRRASFARENDWAGQWLVP
jgi:pyridoxamine 5'-phosphate oxidase